VLVRRLFPNLGYDPWFLCDPTRLECRSACVGKCQERAGHEVKVAPVDRADAQAWLDRYIAAWLSYDPNDIAALFTEGVAYRYHPHDEPITGREAVVASWLGEDTSNGASTRDASGTYTAHYEPVAVDDDVVVATGTSIYRERPDGPIARVYDNCFVMRFDADGRCREFTEYYVQRPA
jgi:hypothetical protein